MVNRVLIERILADIKTNVKELRDANDITWDTYRTDIRARRFVERTLHITIEGCIDAAQHIISDQEMREPTSYRDTFVVLTENKILSTEDLSRFENIASFRNLLVHYYEKWIMRLYMEFLKTIFPISIFSLNEWSVFLESGAVSSQWFVSFCPQIALFRKFGINRQNCLCGLRECTSAQPTDILKLAGNLTYMDRKLIN